MHVSDICSVDVTKQEIQPQDSSTQKFHSLIPNIINSLSEAKLIGHPIFSAARNFWGNALLGLALTLLPPITVSAADTGATNINHIEAAKKYRSTAEELRQLLPADHQSNLKHMIASFNESALLRSINTEISNKSPRQIKSDHNSISYSLSQSEKEALAHNNKMQEVKRKAEQAAASKDPNAERYRNQLALVVSDLSYSLHKLATFHETLNKLNIEIAKRETQQTSSASTASNSPINVQANTLSSSKAANSTLSPCDAKSRKSAPRSNISLAGAELGMSKAALLASTCAEANGKVMLMENPSSINFYDAFRGQGIAEESRLKDLLGRYSNSNNSAAKTAVDAANKVLYEPVEKIRLCIDCQPQANGHPSGSPDRTNGLTIRFLRDGYAVGIQRNHLFKNTPTTVANFLSPMLQHWGPPSYQFAQGERILVGWVFQAGNQALPTEHWYSRQLANRKTQIELNRDGLLEESPQANPRMRIAAQKPQATYCIGRYMRGTGPITREGRGRAIERYYPYAKDWQDWDIYLFERSQGKASPKRNQPIIEKYATPGYTTQCGSVVLAELHLAKAPAFDGLPSKRVNLQSSDLLQNATVELLDTNKLANNIETLNYARMQLETYERNEFGSALPLSMEDAKKAAALTTTPSEAEKRYASQNANDMQAWKSCLYREKTNADIQDYTRCQSLDPHGRPVSHWNQTSNR